MPFPESQPTHFTSLIAAPTLHCNSPSTPQAKSVGSYILRVSFGTTLLVSVAVVYSAIFVLLSSNKDDNRRSDSGGGGGMRMGYGFSPLDMFWYWDPYYYQRSRQRMEEDPYYQMNFLESVFSFVFGERRPNETDALMRMFR